MIDYSVPKTGRVNLDVFDITGRKVTSLVDEVKSAGNYRYDFNASNLATGIYLYTLKADGVNITKKMMLVK